MSHDLSPASVGSDGSSSHRQYVVPPGPTVPTLHPLSWTPDGFSVGGPEKLTSVLASESPVCLVTLSKIYDDSMDIHHVQEIHDQVRRRLTPSIVLLAMPGESRRGNTPWEFHEALIRLDRLGIRCVHEPSAELVAYLGTGDKRDGMRNALHRFQNGKLFKSWIATIADPTERHYAGRDVLVFKRDK